MPFGLESAPSLYWMRAMASPLLTGGNFGAIGRQMQQEGGNAFGSMTPEQAMAMMQDPRMRETLARFGLSPIGAGQIKQSPFFSQGFSAEHPGFSNIASHALAGLASTPAAAPVQGFGAGLQQMAQGLAGGPEMLRRYQVGQITSPAQAMSLMMPAYGAGVYKQMVDMMQNQMASAQAQKQQYLTAEEQIKQLQAQTAAYKAQAERTGNPAFDAADKILKNKFGADWEKNPQAMTQLPGLMQNMSTMLPGVAAARERGQQRLGLEYFKFKYGAKDYQPPTLKGQVTPKALSDIDRWKTNTELKLQKDADSRFQSWWKAHQFATPDEIAQAQQAAQNYLQSGQMEIESGYAAQLKRFGQHLIAPAGGQQQGTPKPKGGGPKTASKLPVVILGKPPAGATSTALGSDGNQYYLDAQGNPLARIQPTQKP